MALCPQCILQWSEVQLATSQNQEPAAILTCPLCKQPYTSFIYDCHEKAYRRHEVVKGAQTGGIRDAASLRLSPAQRRRRSLYFQAAAAETLEDGGTVASRECSTGDPQGSRAARLQPSQVKRPAVAAWLRRELQALMLEEEVDLVAQHLLGTVRALSSASPIKSRREQAAPKALANKEEWLKTVGDAARVYLFDSAGQFAAQLWGFIASGLSVQAHDTAVFGPEPSPAATATHDVQSWGDGRDDFIAQLHSQDTSEDSFSRSKDEGADAVSDDSGAYLPMVREATRSTAASSRETSDADTEQERL